MAVVLAGLSEAVGALTDQPADALNDGRRTIEGVTAVGDAIIAHHVAAVRREFPPRHVDARRSEQPAPDVRVQVETEPEASKDVTASAEPDADVVVRLAASERDKILVARAARIVHAVFPTLTAGKRFGVLVGPYLDMEEWREWREMNAAIEEFFDCATSPEPAPEDAKSYDGGRIGGRVCVPARLVRSKALHSWQKPRTIAATHSGALKLLETLDARLPVGEKFEVWLRMLVCEYRLLLRFVPDAVLQEERWEDDSDTLGHFEIYYTALTLVHLYGVTAVVRGLARPSAPLADTAPIMDRAREIVDRYVDDGRKTFVFSIEDPGARGTVSSRKRSTESGNEWRVVLDAELPIACAYEDDARVPYGMWAQAHQGAPKAVYSGLSLPSDVPAVDAHFVVHMKSRYLPHREMPLAFPLESMPLAGVPEPVRMPMAPFVTELETASLEEGTSVTRYTVGEMALMDATYQFAAPAWVGVSYTIPAGAAGAPVKHTQFADVRLHAAESVVAVFMAQTLAHMASARMTELELGEDGASADADYSALLARAVLFHNVCE